jgi:hypothetical protein
MGLDHRTVPHSVLVLYSTTRFASGHLWLYPGEKLAYGWFYATLLREPLDRFLSQYYYHRQHATSRPTNVALDYVTRAAIESDLEKYLDHSNGDVRRSYANSQALHFASRVSNCPENFSDAALLDAAVAGLEDYNLIGCYDDIQGFFDRYCLWAGAQPITLPRLNVTSQRLGIEDLPEPIRDRLVAANRVDSALVEWARRRSQQARASVLVRVRRALRRGTAPALSNFGTREIEIQAVRVQGQSGRGVEIAAGETVETQLACQARVCEPDLTIGIIVHNSVGEAVIAANSKTLNSLIAIDEVGPFFVTIRFRAAVPPGEYQITLALHRGITHLDHCFHWWTRCASFRVRQGQQQVATESEAELSIHKGLGRSNMLADESNA